MKIELLREPRSPDQTTGSSILGHLTVDGSFECYSLERKGVEIPVGSYPIELTFSPHFQRELPLLDGVPGRSAIRIHPGNIPSDSEGCILVGSSRTSDGEVEGSRIAFQPLFDKIKAALDRTEQVTIDVVESA